MSRQAPNIQLVTPAAAAYLWRISEARMRQLRLDGELKTRVVRWGNKPFHAYTVESCRARWGDPDSDRLDLTLTVEWIDATAAVTWELIAVLPRVED